MLRLSQKLGSQLSKCGALAGAQRRLYSDAVEVQAGADTEVVKPYDPNGPPSQIDAYMEGLDESYVSSFRNVKNLIGELEKLKSERARAGPSKPLGLVTDAAGNIDKDHYLKTMNLHPDMVAVLDKVMAEDVAGRPKAVESNPWADYHKSIQPILEAEHKKLDEEEAAIAKESEKLQKIEARLDDITVDEMLEMYPDIAREIKAEIESGDFEERPMGYVAIAEK